MVESSPQPNLSRAAVTAIKVVLIFFSCFLFFFQPPCMAAPGQHQNHRQHWQGGPCSGPGSRTAAHDRPWIGSRSVLESGVDLLGESLVAGGRPGMVEEDAVACSSRRRGLTPPAQTASDSASEAAHRR